MMSGKIYYILFGIILFVIIYYLNDTEGFRSRRRRVCKKWKKINVPFRAPNISNTSRRDNVGSVYPTSSSSWGKKNRMLTLYTKHGTRYYSIPITVGSLGDPARSNYRSNDRSSRRRKNVRGISDSVTGFILPTGYIITFYDNPETSNTSDSNYVTLRGNGSRQTHSRIPKASAFAVRKAYTYKCAKYRYVSSGRKRKPTPTRRKRSSYNYKRPSYNYKRYKRPTYSYKKPTYSYKKPTYSYKKPTYSYKKPTYSYKKPTYSYKRPTYSYKKPTYSYKRPTYSYKQPTYSYKQPTCSSQNRTLSARKRQYLQALNYNNRLERSVKQNEAAKNKCRSVIDNSVKNLASAQDQALAAARKQLSATDTSMIYAQHTNKGTKNALDAQKKSSEIMKKDSAKSLQNLTDAQKEAEKTHGQFRAEHDKYFKMINLGRILNKAESFTDLPPPPKAEFFEDQEGDWREKWGKILKGVNLPQGRLDPKDSPMHGKPNIKIPWVVNKDLEETLNRTAAQYTSHKINHQSQGMLTKARGILRSMNEEQDENA